LSTTNADGFRREVQSSDQDSLPADSPPIQVFKHLTSHPDQNHSSELNRKFWQMLTVRLGHKTSQDGELTFSKTEQIQFNHGICCGEQLCNDPEVEAFVKEHDPDEGSPWSIIYGECFDQLKDFEVSPPFHTITDWVILRNERDRLYAEAEQFIVPNDLIEKLPQGADRYISLRNSRKKMLQGFGKLISKLPGQQDKLIEIIVNGRIHDQMDFLASSKHSSGNDLQRLKNTQKIWGETCTKLKIVYKHPNVAAAINKVNDLTAAIKTIMMEFNINNVDLITKVKSMYLEDEPSKRRLSKEVNLLKNNLNIGSLKNTGKPYNPYTRSWPSTIDLSACRIAMEQCYTLDRTSSQHTSILLMPGIDHGFFEFDNGAIILPIGHEDGLSPFVQAMADRRFIQETLKDSSPFLTSISELCGDQKPQAFFKDLFSKWVQSNGCIHNKSFFAEDESLFLISHIAPPIEQLFLRDEDFLLDRKVQLELIQNWKNKNIAIKDLPKIAAIFYQSKRYKEAASILGSLCLYEKESKYAFAQVVCYHKAGLNEKADITLNKCQTNKNLSYYSFALEAWLSNHHESQR
jgi:hypothetical protein